MSIVFKVSSQSSISHCRLKAVLQSLKTKMSSALIYLSFLATCISIISSDVTDGFDCRTFGQDSRQSKVCTGVNNNYKAALKTIRDKKNDLDDVQTRYFRPPCTSNNVCTAFEATYAPTVMTNAYGQVRYIYQDEDFGFTQNIRVVSCRSGKCARGQTCHQSFRDYYLIAWDPTSTNWNPIVDRFSVPDCCKCRL